MKIALRVRKDTGEIYVLDRGASGKFEFGDPSLGDEKHHSAKHLVTKDTLDDAISAIDDGFHPRMRGLDTDQLNMISPKNVIVIDVPT